MKYPHMLSHPCSPNILTILVHADSQEGPHQFQIILPYSHHLAFLAAHVVLLIVNCQLNSVIVPSDTAYHCMAVC